jgi:hypothetical protein
MACVTLRKGTMQTPPPVLTPPGTTTSVPSPRPVVGHVQARRASWAESMYAMFVAVAPRIQVLKML